MYTHVSMITDPTRHTRTHTSKMAATAATAAAAPATTQKRWHITCEETKGMDRIDRLKYVQAKVLNVLDDVIKTRKPHGVHIECPRRAGKTEMAIRELKAMSAAPEYKDHVFYFIATSKRTCKAHRERAGIAKPEPDAKAPGRIHFFDAYSDADFEVFTTMMATASIRAVIIVDEIFYLGNNWYAALERCDTNQLILAFGTPKFISFDSLEVVERPIGKAWPFIHMYCPVMPTLESALAAHKHLPGVPLDACGNVLAYHHHKQE